MVYWKAPRVLWSANTEFLARDDRTITWMIKTPRNSIRRGIVLWTDMLHNLPGIGVWYFCPDARWFHGGFASIVQSTPAISMYTIGSAFSPRCVQTANDDFCCMMTNAWSQSPRMLNVSDNSRHAKFDSLRSCIMIVVQQTGDLNKILGTSIDRYMRETSQIHQSNKTKWWKPKLLGDKLVQMSWIRYSLIQNCVPHHIVQHPSP